MAQRNGFVAIETIAVALLIVLVIVAVAAILLLPKNQAPQSPGYTVQDSESFSEKVRKLQDKKNTVVKARDLFSPAYQGTPFNELLFQDTQGSLGGGQARTNTGTVTSRMQAEVRSVALTPTDLTMQLTGILPSVYGKSFTYMYTSETLPKIRVSYGILADIKQGDRINIDETSDFSQKYPESIVKIDISKIE